MMYVYIHTGMYVYTYLCIYAYIHAHIRSSMYVCVCMYDSGYLYISFSSNIATKVENVVLVKANYLF